MRESERGIIKSERKAPGPVSLNRKIFFSFFVLIAYSIDTHDLGLCLDHREKKKKKNCSGFQTEERMESQLKKNLYDGKSELQGKVIHWIEETMNAFGHRHNSLLCNILIGIVIGNIATT